MVGGLMAKEDYTFLINLFMNFIKCYNEYHNNFMFYILNVEWRNVYNSLSVVPLRGCGVKWMICADTKLKNIFVFFIELISATRQTLPDSPTLFVASDGD